MDQNHNNNYQGEQNQGSSSGHQGGGSFLDKLTSHVNTAAGGGKESEKNEDYLDKGNKCMV